KMWAERRDNCDALGMNNFYELQQIAVKSWLMSGDIFAVMQRRKTTPTNPYTLRLQLVEADRVSTPGAGKGVWTFAQTEGKAENGNKIHDGVEVDPFGQVVAYHICSVYPGQIYSEDPKWTRVEARGKLTGMPNILHVMDAERPDQYRGVTFIAPVIEMLLQLRRYTEAELTAALVQTYLTAWITRNTGDDIGLNEVGAGDVNGTPADQPDNISEDQAEYEMGPGTINFLADGENVVLGNPNIPTAGFENFVKMLCRLTGASFELPYDVLIKEFNSSYSAAKGALEEAWEMIKMRRSWFVADFCQPVYEAWLAEAVATGRIQAPGFFNDPAIRAAWCGARWDGPAQTHLDPVKEATANEKLVQNGWKTNEQVTREFYGGSFEDNAEQLKHEREIFAPEKSAPPVTEGAPTKEGNNAEGIKQP
ncbi:MAG: phage portal protein, partial [Clostridia bacterium]|nr:phage portal protein [Clostridia bacterium]